MPCTAKSCEVNSTCNFTAGTGARPAPRVCILGGGFGGLYTAVRLDQLLWPQNTKPQVGQRAQPWWQAAACMRWTHSRVASGSECLAQQV